MGSIYYPQQIPQTTRVSFLIAQIDPLRFKNAVTRSIFRRQSRIRFSSTRQPL